MTLDPSYFIFVLSGFITVWSFRFVTKSKKTGDFEYLGLSVFWGLFTLMFFEYVIHDIPKIQQLLSNQYAAGAVLSLIGGTIGLAAGLIVKREKVYKHLEKILTLFSHCNKK